MENRFIETVKKIDAVLILVAGVALIIFLCAAAYDMFGGHDYEPPNQIIIADTSDPDDNTEVRETVSFMKAVKDVYVFAVQSTAIRSDELVEGSALGKSMQNSFKSFNPAVANLIFVKDGVQKRLFDKNALIYKYSFAYFDSEPYQLMCDYNIYAVVNQDTNNDKLLNGMDNVSLYVSDYDGNGLEQISQSINSFNFTGGNAFVFSEYDSKTETFYRYDRTTHKKIPLTSVEQQVDEKNIGLYD